MYIKLHNLHGHGPCEQEAIPAVTRFVDSEGYLSG